MKALKVVAQIVGYAAIAFAALMFFIGETWAGIMFICVGVFLLATAPKLMKPAATEQPGVKEVPAESSPEAPAPAQPAGKASLMDDLPDWESKKTKQKRQTEERKQQAAAEGVACCPRCGSTSLSLNKKGFGGGKATAGMIGFGLGGAVAGTYGMNKMKITCMNCGYTYKPGKKTRI